MENTHEANTYKLLLMFDIFTAALQDLIAFVVVSRNNYLYALKKICTIVIFTFLL